MSKFSKATANNPLWLNIILVIVVILVVAAFVLGCWALGGLIIWALWNWVAVALGASPISYWLGVGIYICLTVLGSFFRVRTTSS